MRRLGRCRHCRRYIARDASHCPFCQTRAVHGTLGARGGAVARALYGVLAASVSAGCGPAAAPAVEPALIEPEPETDQVAEAEPDVDQDGLVGAADACPLDPEDKDGWKDDDGCPDPDNDADGIPDVDDQCPLEAEDFDGLTDLDGCPDVTMVPLYGDPGRFAFREQVFFAARSEAISPEARPMLTEVATVLEANPQFDRVALEGHTDNKERSSDKRQRLSEKRAEAVRDALVELGVDPTRLEVVGYADDRPIADNETEEGRAQNRRVEFVIRGVRSSPVTAAAARWCARRARRSHG